MNMKKEKKIKINYITYIKNHYIPTTVNMKEWISKSLLAELPSQINIIFAGKKRIRTLNNKYLNKNFRWSLVFCLKEFQAKLYRVTNVIV